jgi:raffinose/stachyose/melibiose transport system permease protein
LAPALLLLAVFLLYPLGKTLYYSFAEWHNFSPGAVFAGLDNYHRMLKDPVIRTALKNTGILMLGSLAVQVGFALVLAIFADSAKRGFRFFRTVFFFPIVISGTAIGMMFAMVYKYEYGLLNFFITLFGGEKQVWITQRTSVFLVLIPLLWQYVGFYFVILLTGIAKIPGDIYESALLDGISPFQKAIYLTIPLLKDVLISTVILVISSCFKVFDTVYVITKGGPLDSSQMLSTYMYQMAFEKYNGGYASAIAILMILLGIGITVLIRKLLRADSDEY